MCEVLYSVVASAVPCRWSWCAELAEDSQHYNVV